MVMDSKHDPYRSSLLQSLAEIRAKHTALVVALELVAAVSVKLGYAEDRFLDLARTMFQEALKTKGAANG
jgi:hypothetical protein